MLISLRNTWDSLLMDFFYFIILNKIPKFLLVVISHIAIYILVILLIIREVLNFCFDYSASHCDVDENGVQHMIFCRVIMGNTEVVYPGTRQYRPSDIYSDSGVDDLQNPRFYIIWTMNMNTHIFPEFVVSFKFSSEAEGEFFIPLLCSLVS